jgi:hypothetical protein
MHNHVENRSKKASIRWRVVCGKDGRKLLRVTGDDNSPVRVQGSERKGNEAEAELTSLINDDDINGQRGSLVSV